MEQYLALSSMGKGLPLGSPIWTSESPASLEDSRRMRQWTLTSPYV